MASRTILRHAVCRALKMGNWVLGISAVGNKQKATAASRPITPGFGGWTCNGAAGSHTFTGGGTEEISP